MALFPLAGMAVLLSVWHLGVARQAPTTIVVGGESQAQAWPRD
jgi:hypothetical protein